MSEVQTTRTRRKLPPRSDEYRRKQSESIRRLRAEQRLRRLAEQDSRISLEGALRLPCGRVTRFDAADLPLIRSRFWKAVRCHHGSGFYVRSDSRPLVFLHRLLMGENGDLLVDHRDCDGLNNQRDNLRWATHSQNCVNTKELARGQSGLRGVRKTRNGRWNAAINVNKVRIGLGNHRTPEDAARAYDRAAREHFGEFARLNFPEDCQ